MNAKAPRRQGELARGTVGRHYSLGVFPWRFGLLAFISVLFAFVPHVGEDETVKVSITVTVPKDTDEKATLYLAGNLKDVGEWKEDGVALARNSDGTYRLEKNLPKGETLEYKITGGSWASVEKDANGGEIENRTLKLDGDKDEKITVQSWASKPAPGSGQKQSTITGDVRTHERFASKALGNERTILVWLPPGYDKGEQRYPVLYLHDGQNCFDASTSFAGEWRADETADELIRAGKIQPIIMVAIANGGAARIDEYTPTRDASRARGVEKGELYARFLIDEAKPFIDSHYRTLADREHTAVAGSSLGGLISLYLGYKHSDVFGMCGVISPSLFWDNQQLLKSIQSNPSPLIRERIWLDIGTAEGPAEEASVNVANVQSLADVLRTSGLKEGTDFVHRTIPGAAHNEKAWASRFGDVLQFLFGKS